MKNKRVRTAVLILAMLTLSAYPAFAASSATATVPVTLTVSNEYRAVSVTVPASMPVYVVNGAVITADSAKITNNAPSGAVRVTAVNVKNGEFTVGNYDSFSGSKSIALKLNGCPTSGEGSLTISRSAFPDISAGSSLDLKYFVKVSADIQNVTNTDAMSVIFTISTVG